MQLIKQLQHQYSFHNRYKTELTQTFYKKINKKYMPPIQRINSTLIKDKQHRNQKQVILVTIQQEMRRGLFKLPFIENPQDWMILGMMKNRLYCRKRGDRNNIKSSHNLELIKSQFIISEYYKKIDAIKRKKKIERSKPIPANRDKLHIVKNNINSLYLPSL